MQIHVTKSILALWRAFVCGPPQPHPPTHTPPPALRQTGKHSNKRTRTSEQANMQTSRQTPPGRTGEQASRRTGKENTQANKRPLGEQANRQTDPPLGEQANRGTGKQANNPLKRANKRTGAQANKQTCPSPWANRRTGEQANKQPLSPWPNKRTGNQAKKSSLRAKGRASE